MKTSIIRVEITVPMRLRLQSLVATGFYGLSVEEAARRVMESELRVKSPGGFKPAIMPKGKNYEH